MAGRRGLILCLVLLSVLSVGLTVWSGAAAGRDEPISSSSGVTEIRAGQETVTAFANQNWRIGIADMPGFFDAMSDHSLRFDSAGNLHLVYGGDRLYYAIFDGDQWQVEIVDQSIGTGTGASLDLDGEDRPHISYLDLPNLKLKYAHQDGDDWVLEVIDSAYPYQERTSIAVDGDGRPHIAYHKFEPLPPDYHFGLGYASWDGSQWQIERFNEVGGFVSLALDSAGMPHISFYESAKIQHATWQGSGWQIDDVGISSCGYGSSVAVDSADRPHVVYVDNEDSGQLIYAQWDGNSWVSQALQPAEAGLNLSLVLDEADEAHIAYGSEYITPNGGDVQRPASASTVPGSFSAIALDGDGYPAISYLSYFKSLYCRRWDGLEWQSDLVDEGADAGLHNGLALDSSGEPHVSYYRQAGNGGAIVYAHRSDYSWTTETISGTYMPAYHQSEYDTSIALDSSDRPHVSFWSSSYYNAGLYYAYKSGEAWQTELIADDVGGSNELVVDGADRPHVAFVDSGTVKYASRPGGAWDVEDVISNAYSSFVGLDLTPAGEPRIVFVDVGGGSPILKYAALTEGGWAFEEIATIPAGMYVEASLILDGAGRPHVGYTISEEDNTELKYATRNGGGWVIENVVARQWGLGRPAVVLANDGSPAIVFAYDGVELATREEGVWDVRQAFGTWQLASELSAAADGSRLFVGYRDRHGHGLVVAGPDPLTEHLYLPAIRR